MGKLSEILSCQQVLSITVFLGFMIHHMLRVNISIAIVEMVSRNSTTQTKAPIFHWTEKEKNDVLGYFFWGYIITQIPGGRLSEKFGPKIVIGLGLFIASLITLLTPIVATSFGHLSLVISRFLLGVALGIHWPSGPPIATNWIAPTNRSTFLSHMVASSLGVAVTLPVCGYILATFGWPSVFYTTGLIALIWVLSWFYLIYDTPQNHPRISVKEKEKLLSEIGISRKTKRSTPWKEMLTSGAVWAIMIGNSCQSTTFFIVFNQLPTYMSQVLHYNIQENGLLCGLPYLTRYFAALAASIFADKLIQNQKISITNIRKLFTVSSFFGTCCLFIIQVFWGHSRLVSILVFTSSFALMGLITPGVYANSMDISPSYSGTIFGISQVPGALTGYLTTKVVAYFTNEKQDFDHWKYVFWMLVAVNLFSAISVLILISGEEQSWSKCDKEDDCENVKISKEKDCI